MVHRIKSSSQVQYDQSADNPWQYSTGCRFWRDLQQFPWNYVFGWRTGNKVVTGRTCYSRSTALPNDSEASAVSYVNSQESRQTRLLRSETVTRSSTSSGFSLSLWCIFCDLQHRNKFRGAEVSLVNCELDFIQQRVKLFPDIFIFCCTKAQILGSLSLWETFTFFSEPEMRMRKNLCKMSGGLAWSFRKSFRL